MEEEKGARSASRAAQPPTNGGAARERCGGTEFS
jgi:hypothetical protein